MRDNWDDFVQDVLIALIQHRPESREPGAIVRHIQTTCYRRYIDEIRRVRGRKRRTKGDEESSSGWRRNVSLEAASEEDLSEQFWSRQMDLDVRTALESLEERKRRVLEAVYLAGFTYDEAAAHLSIPLGTLKGLLREGLKELRQSIVGGNEKMSSDSDRRSVSPVEASSQGSGSPDG
jgi:RNA polymerase sigma-70 factor (ECF subfamily)